MNKLDDLIEEPFAVFCHDAGAANLIIEWLKDCNLEMKVCMEGPAKELWRRNFPNTNLYPLDAVLDGVTTMLSGTGWGGCEFIARNKAKKRNIKNIAVIDHWVNYKERFVNDEQEELPDMIIVSDKYAYQTAELIFPTILVIQLPNNYLVRVANKACLHRKKECQKPFENILIIAEPIREKISNVNNLKEIESIDYFMNSLDKISLHENQVNIKLRLHPSEPFDKYDFIKKKYNNRNIKLNITRNKELYEDIAWADLVVGMNSFALIVAVNADVPTMSILPPDSPRCILPYDEIVHLSEL
jgi:hypothetical protein